VPTNERGYEVPTLATDAVLIEDGQVLLIRRGKDPAEGQWALPGGFVEVGETIEQACVRELAEETGIEAEPVELVGVYSDPDRDPRGHIISTPFVVRRTTEAEGIDAAGADDAAEAAWFDLVDLPAMAFDHGQILDDAKGRIEAARR
jgi:8-oxo-dGTP diphosphatase